MGIANYSTTVSVSKTVSEIETMLAQSGARSILKDYDEAGPIALTFVVFVHGTAVNFRLPSNWEGVLIAMQTDPSVPKRFHTEFQARCVAWRILKDWIRAQMAIIEAGLSSISEVFMPYAVTSNGQTLFQRWSEQPQYLLEA